jgi:hypothetical protein
MRRAERVCTALLFATAIWAPHAHAQTGIPFQPNALGSTGGPYQSPINPYINILRGGAYPAVNYFNIVQPQLQFNSAIGQLQTQQNLLGQAIANPNVLGESTGHPTAFGNWTHYYSYQGAGVGGGGTSRLGMVGAGAGVGSLGTGGVGMGGTGGGGLRTGASGAYRPGR